MDPICVSWWAVCTYCRSCWSDGSVEVEDNQSYKHTHTYNQLLSFHHPPCCGVGKDGEGWGMKEGKPERNRKVRGVWLRRENTHPDSSHYSPYRDVLETSCSLFLWHKHSKGFIQSGTGTNSPFTLLSLSVFLFPTNTSSFISFYDGSNSLRCRQNSCLLWSCASFSP